MASSSSSSSSLYCSSSGSSKRAKAAAPPPGNNVRCSQAVSSCLVDGCNAELSQCKEYHRRHKVCELHSKSPMVTIAGHGQQRFCQQCSRFHSLVEFDEAKRSCRKRLDGHNRRRRKTQSDFVSRNSATKFLSNQQGSTMLSFSSQQILPSTTASPARVGAHKAENDYVNGHGSPFRSFYPHQLPLNPTSSGNKSSRERMLYDGFSQDVYDSGGALSLLSSSPAESRDIRGMQQYRRSPGDRPRPQGRGVVVDFKSSGGGGSSNGEGSSFHYCEEMFQNGSSANESHHHHQQTNSFMWE